jgi:hypothetical protein
MDEGVGEITGQAAHNQAYRQDIAQNILQERTLPRGSLAVNPE